MGYLTLAIIIAGFIYQVDLISYPTGAILVNNNYIRCKDVNFHTQRLVCEIHSQEDEMKIERFGLSGCYGSTLSCAEGDIKTCIPLMTINTLHYQCYCHSDHDGLTNDYDYYWTEWQQLNVHFKKFKYSRRLVIDSEMDYLAEEYTHVLDLYIVANYSLPDSVYSASSEYNSGHGAKRARIDDYLNYPCSWSANERAPDDPWLQISLPNEYVVTGVYIKKRCDDKQYPTMVDVMTSSDDVTWESVVRGDNIEDRYSSDDNTASVNIRFSERYTTKYWRVIITEYVRHPSMKLDLLGYSLE